MKNKYFIWTVEPQELMENGMAECNVIGFYLN
jgi:hypothetical protein